MLAKNPALRREPQLAVPPVTAADLPALLEPIAAPIPPQLGVTIDFVVRRNDTLDRIFRQLKLNLDDLALIREMPGVRDSLDQLRPGDTITVTHDAGLVRGLKRRISETEVLSVTRGTEGFAAEVINL